MSGPLHKSTSKSSFQDSQESNVVLFGVPENQSIVEVKSVVDEVFEFLWETDSDKGYVPLGTVATAIIFLSSTSPPSPAALSRSVSPSPASIASSSTTIQGSDGSHNGSA